MTCMHMYVPGTLYVEIRENNKPACESSVGVKVDYVLFVLVSNVIFLLMNCACFLSAVGIMVPHYLELWFYICVCVCVCL